MADVNTHAGNVRLIGGRLCLDFVNTVDSHEKTQPKEYLVDYAAFVVWSRHAGILGEAAADERLREATRRPEAAATVLQRAMTLRRALYDLFSSMANGRAPHADYLATLNDALAAAPHRSRIVAVPSGDATLPGFIWAWAGDTEMLERPLWAVLWSAADLLTAAAVASVGRCEGENCSWLFLDTSRNRSRRWCAMEDCGNRAKARRYYARKQPLRET